MSHHQFDDYAEPSVAAHMVALATSLKTVPGVPTQPPAGLPAAAGPEAWPVHASLPLTYHPVPCIAWVRASAPALDPLRASSA